MHCTTGLQPPQTPSVDVNHVPPRQRNRTAFMAVSSPPPWLPSTFCCTPTIGLSPGQYEALPQVPHVPPLFALIHNAPALSTLVNFGLGSAACACTEAWRWISAMLSEAEEQLPSGAGELVPYHAPAMSVQRMFVNCIVVARSRCVGSVYVRWGFKGLSPQRKRSSQNDHGIRIYGSVQCERCYISRWWICKGSVQYYFGGAFLHRLVRFIAKTKNVIDTMSSWWIGGLQKTSFVALVFHQSPPTLSERSSVFESSFFNP